MYFSKAPLLSTIFNSFFLGQASASFVTPPKDEDSSKNVLVRSQASSTGCFECSVERRTGTDFSVAVQEMNGQQHDWTFNRFLDGYGYEIDLERNGSAKAKWDPDAGDFGRYYFQWMNNGVLPTCDTSDDGWFEIKLQETNSPSSFGTGKFVHLGQTNGVCLYRFVVYCNCGISNSPSIYPSTSMPSVVPSKSLIISSVASPTLEPTLSSTSMPSDVIIFCSQCTVQQFSGQSLEATDSVDNNIYNIYDLGNTGSEYKQFDSYNNTYLVGTFQTFDGDNKAIYTNGDSTWCSTERSGTFEIEETDDPSQDGVMTASEPSICVYKFVRKCYCDPDMPSLIPSSQPSVSPSSKPQPVDSSNQAELTIESTLTLDGVGQDEFESDPEGQTQIVQDSIQEIVNNDGSRHLQGFKEVTVNSVTFSSSGEAVVDFTITMIVFCDAVCSVDEVSDLADSALGDVTSTLTESISSGAFAETLVETAQEAGSAAFDNVSVDASSLQITVTYSITSDSPTASPDQEVDHPFLNQLYTTISRIIVAIISSFGFLYNLVCEGSK